MNTGLRAVAAAAAGVLLMGASLTARANITAFTPAAYAESELMISNFRFTDFATGLPLATQVGPGGRITDLTATLTSTLSASINGVQGVVTGPPSGSTIFPLIGNPTIDHSINAGGGYVPYASFGVGTMGPGIFAGASSNHAGNGLQLNGNPTTTANTHAQVNINGGSAIGSADSRQTLGTLFSITLGAPLVVDVNFDAAAFLRVALGQLGVLANATRSWTLTVTPAGALTPLVDWSPDGAAGGLGGTCFGAGACIELADGFDLNFEAIRQSTDDVDQTLGGTFGLRVGLGAGTYNVAISHETNADAAAPIPEPGSLALVGAAMLGLVAIRRRFKKA